MINSNMKKLVWVLALVGFIENQTSAAFLITVDPADLQFNGAGNHIVDFLITHNGSGASTLSGYTIRFGSPANASLGVMPTGVTATGATQVLNVSGAGGLFNYNTATNTLAVSNLTINGPFADVGNGGNAILFSLNLVLGSASSYTIGVDFQNAQRGGLLATEIGNEFFNPNSPTTDFSFTLQSVPEPSSLLLVVSISAMGCRRLFRKSPGSKPAKA